MDKISKDIIRFWGDSLNKINIELIKGYSLSVETIEFLSGVGLPLDNDVLINFNNNSKLKRYILGNYKFIIIGDDYGTQIGIHQSTNEIFSFDYENKIPQRFVNSNIKKLLQFLMIYIDNQSKLVATYDEDAIEVVNKIKEEYNKIDSIALADDENWWSVILEQIEQGVM